MVDQHIDHAEVQDDFMKTVTNFVATQFEGVEPFLAQNNVTLKHVVWFVAAQIDSYRFKSFATQSQVTDQLDLYKLFQSVMYTYS